MDNMKARAEAANWQNDGMTGICQKCGSFKGEWFNAKGYMADRHHSLCTPCLTALLDEQNTRGLASAPPPSLGVGVAASGDVEEARRQHEAQKEWEACGFDEAPVDGCFVNMSPTGPHYIHWGGTWREVTTDTYHEMERSADEYVSVRHNASHYDGGVAWGRRHVAPTEPEAAPTCDQRVGEYDDKQRCDRPAWWRLPTKHDVTFTLCDEHAQRFDSAEPIKAAPSVEETIREHNAFWSDPVFCGALHKHDSLEAAQECDRDKYATDAVLEVAEKTAASLPRTCTQCGAEEGYVVFYTLGACADCACPDQFGGLEVKNCHPPMRGRWTPMSPTGCSLRGRKMS